MIKISENEIQFEYIRASGPGGQNVNKVSSAVQLRFNLQSSTSFSADVKARLIKLAGKRMTDDGILIIEAKRYRDQERNKQDALNRLYALVEQAAQPPAERKPTRVTTTQKQARLEEKRRRAEIKRNRASTREILE